MSFGADHGNRDLGVMAAELDEGARIFVEPGAFVIEGNGRVVISRREVMPSQ